MNCTSNLSVLNSKRALKTNETRFARAAHMRSCVGVELLLASNGQEGIALARQRRPDLVLLDMHLPDISGPQVLEALRGDPSTRDIRVVVLSAGAMSDDIARARAAGATEYWTKPFKIATLRSDVQRLLSEEVE